MTHEAALVAARRDAAIFRLDDRAVLEVRGADRVPFLQGQLTNDVAALDPSGPNAGCHALALTREGRIVAEFHVVVREDSIWLETDAVLAGAAVERLAKYVVADDVAIEDVSASFARFAIEGPRAQALVAAAAGASLTLAPEQVATLRIGGAVVVAAAWGLGGAAAVQLVVPRAAADAVASSLSGVAPSLGAVAGDAIALETLRIEAGIPRAGAEIGIDTLPAELGLVERAVSFTKGCFTGQEVVTRMHSRGRVGHRLVGVAFGPRADLPSKGTAVVAVGSRIGEVTSAAVSPMAGVIALAIVRRGSEAPGTEVEVAGQAARIVALPFVPLPDSK